MIAELVHVILTMQQCAHTHTHTIKHTCTHAWAAWLVCMCMYMHMIYAYGHHELPGDLQDSGGGHYKNYI